MNNLIEKQRLEQAGGVLSMAMAGEDESKWSNTRAKPWGAECLHFTKKSQ